MNEQQFMITVSHDLMSISPLLLTIYCGFFLQEPLGKTYMYISNRITVYTFKHLKYAKIHLDFKGTYD